MNFRSLVIYGLGGLLLLLLTSLLALYTYGRFVDRALGEPGHALPAEPASTALDLAIGPLAQAHPGQTGLRLVEDNLDAFAVRAQSARAAGRSLDVQYYIWNGDATGRLLARELLLAADRGVRVRVLLDDINARGKDAAIFALDSHPNIEVRLFNPSRNRAGVLGRAIEMLLRGVSLNRRMHNKIWIADNRVAVVGGRNIGDEYFGAGGGVDFKDVDVLLAGAAVAECSAIFDAFWNSRAVIPIGALIQARRMELGELRAHLEKLAGELAESIYLRELAQFTGAESLSAQTFGLVWTSRVQVWSDPPDKAYLMRDRLESQWLIRNLMPVLRGAREELLVVSPYFVPGEAGCNEFAALARKGVDTRVLTNSLEATDVALVHAGYSRYRSCLLEGGVQLYELMPREETRMALFGSSRASLHTKSAVVDGRFGFVGSFNVDPRSIQLNTEMGVFFEAPELARRLRANFLRSAAADASYRLELRDGALVWEDGSQEPPRLWNREPEAGVFTRGLIALLRLLPIESQL